MTALADACSIVPRKESLTSHSREEIIKAIKEGAFILDVRTDEEVATGMAENAYHITLSELETALDELPEDKVIVIYCQSGNRSSKAKEYLDSKGFTTINAGGYKDMLTYK